MQPCRRALETDPICSRPGCVVKNSSECAPQGLHPHTSRPLCPSICNIFVLLLWVESQGANAQPHREGSGRGGVWDPSVNGDGIHEVTQWKWRFLGTFHAHMSTWLGWKPAGGWYCWAFCLASHPCAAEAERWASAGAPSPSCLIENRPAWQQVSQPELLTGSEGEALMGCMSAMAGRLTLAFWTLFHPVSCVLCTCAPHDLHTDLSTSELNLMLTVMRKMMLSTFIVLL